MKVFLSILVALAALTAPLAAQADGRAATEAGAVEQMEKGRSLFKARKFAEALQAFESSLALVESPNTRLHIGRCLRELGKLASARTAMRRAASEALDLVSGRGERRYAATAEYARQEADELASRVPHLRLGVPKRVSAGRITLDGAEVPEGSWNTDLEVDPGPHTVAATAPRTRPFSRSVTVTADPAPRVDVVWEHAPTATLRLVLRDKPAGLAIRIDDRPVGPDEIEHPFDVPAGLHTIAASAQGRLPFQVSRPLEDGASEEIVVDLPANTSLPRPPTPRWVAFTAGGVALVSLGVAAGLAVEAKAISNAEQAKPIADRTAARRETVRQLSLAADGLFIGGGALAAGDLVLMLATRWKRNPAADRDERGARLVPLVGPGFSGVTAVGHF